MTDSQSSRQIVRFTKKLFPLVLLLACWVITIRFYWGGYWVLFACGFITLVGLHTWQLLKSQKSLAAPYAKKREQDFKEIFTNPGTFNYSDSGFTVTIQDSPEHIQWQSIEALFGYKLDLYTIDIICMDIHYNDKKILRITEEIPGWHQFLNKVAERFPSIIPGWDIAIIAPAFETKLTLVYEKTGMEFEQAVKSYYSQ